MSNIVKSELKKLTEEEVTLFKEKGNFPTEVFLTTSGKVFCALIEYEKYMKS